MAATFKLLPCPFCGGQARVRAEQKNRTYYIGCAKCGARSRAVGRMPWHDSIYIAQGNAAKLWNERVKAQPNPRPVAHWIYCGDDNTIECEECTASYKLSPYENVTDFSYCPNCGNPMDVFNVKTPEERNNL